MRNKKSKVLWSVLIIVFILLAYALPYTVLSDVQAWYGSFLLWGIIGLLIIIANFMVTRDWGK